MPTTGGRAGYRGQGLLAGFPRSRRAEVLQPHMRTWMMVWTLRVGLAGILVGASMVPARRRRVLLGTSCCQEKQRTPVQVTTLGRALPYSSRTSLPAACTSGSLSTSLANPTPP